MIVNKIDAAPGTIRIFPSNNIPPGWLICNGASLSKSAYPALYEALKGPSGACIYGETADEFNIPDLRGKFVRGLGSYGNGGNNSFNVTQEDTIREIWGFLGWVVFKSGNPGPRAYGAFQMTNILGTDRGDEGGMNMIDVDFSASRYIGVGHISSEIRPYNMAMLFCIKY